jgi:hypothetical protein
MLFQTVQIMTGHHASLAAGASVKIHLECVLFTGPGGVKWDQVAIIVRLEWNTNVCMALRKSSSGRRLLLTSQQFVQKC